MKKVVKVPATSANVGCGFDTLGIAFNLYASFTFETFSEGVLITGCDDYYANKDNLVYTSFIKTCQKLNYQCSGIAITIDSDIPIARGLGSSSACVVGGILGAYAISETPINKDDIFVLAAEIEGHPDNVAPAVYGGLCASFIEEGIPYTMCYKIDERFLFQALIPNFETKTSEARKVLPKKVDFKDALYNLSRITGVIRSFEQYDISLLKASLKDRLHESYRQELIHEYDEVKKICDSNHSLGFFISGSGSTLMNLPSSLEDASCVAKELTRLQYLWRSVMLEVSEKGAYIEEKIC